jgi:hypothetical protein
MASMFSGRSINPARLAFDPFGITNKGHDALGIINPEAPPPLEPAAPPPAPEPMPVRNDAAARTAKRKSVAQQRRRRGRESTILTAFDVDEGKLGG